MNELIKTFLIMIAGMTNYAIPNEVPTIQQVPVNLLQEWVCEGQRCPVAGWFPGGNTVYISNELSVETDPEARGILYHELVHYVQWKEDPNAWADRTCEHIQKYELEAYRLQQHYMQSTEHIFKPHFGMRYRLQC